MNKLGAHWIKVHGRPQDLDYLRQLQPPSVKLVDGNVPDVQWVSDVFVAVPSTWIVLRSHAMSEQKDDVRRDPAGTGARHAREWRSHIDRLRAEAQRRGLPFPPDAQLIVLGINEPILDAPGDLPVEQRMAEMRKRAEELDIYTEALLDTCRLSGLIAGALNLSVGWPTNWDLPGHPRPGAPPDWSVFPRTYKAIKRCGAILFKHEYWDNRGPTEGWRWWAGRYEQCPWDVPIIIGECGLDMYVSRGGEVAEENRGWRGWLKPEQYLAQLQYYHERVILDPRIHSIQPYTSDYSHPWSSFDLLDLYPALVAHANAVKERPLPSKVWTGYVTADKLNFRAGASTDSAVIRTLDQGTAVTVQAQAGDWYLATHDGTPGYVYAAYISDTAPTTVYVPVVQTPSDRDGIIQRLSAEYGVDERLVRAVLKIESGGEGFVNGRLKIRFEPHVFKSRLQAIFDQLFTVGDPAWDGKQHKYHGAPFHGNQEKEHAALASALAAVEAAAYESASYGAPQIMGFNYATAGYTSAKAMMEAFAQDEAAQFKAMFEFFKNQRDINGVSPLDCLRAGDLVSFSRLYNGNGQAEYYAHLILEAM